MLRLVWVFLLMCFSIQAHTVEEKLYKQHADYKIFYSAFNTSFITPDIAAANNIVRGKNKGLVNISVMKDLAVGVPSIITGRVFNILQQSQTLHFEVVKEQQSIYYLAPFEFEDQDYLTFKITAKPNDDSRSYDYDFKFQKKMYHD
jgi:hypothetical protein